MQSATTTNIWRKKNQHCTILAENLAAGGGGGDVISNNRSCHQMELTTDWRLVNR